uniref:G-protein coupled receptors family 1 profile domain-containing protein n=1 Tax=Astyanax mexicanus TaxID=7994 RepID=A0A3B1IZ00_ASTMX
MTLTMPVLNVTAGPALSLSSDPALPLWNCSLAPPPSAPPYNFLAVLLVLLIGCVVFGNVLVCVAVLRERTLQTTTNYLIVSLAVSDLLLATLVMPWAVYLEVPHLRGRISVLYAKVGGAYPGLCCGVKVGGAYSWGCVWS